MVEKCLVHHGILGQKWGVRRYQNYDGSYTQTGLKRYRQSLEKYNEASSRLKKAKESGDSVEISRAKAATKSAKRKVNRDYKQLRKDYRGDQGKELYREGHTILTDRMDRRRIQYGIAGIGYGSALIAGKALSGQNRMKVIGDKVLTYNLGSISAATIAAGTTAANIVIEGIGRNRESKLRAYYGHTRPNN